MEEGALTCRGGGLPGTIAGKSGEENNLGKGEIILLVSRMQQHEVRVRPRS